MLRNLTALWSDEAGATAVEYGLIIAAIAGVIILTVQTLGGTVNAVFQKASDTMP
jgi:pilus assembly protein Flp/PilA